MSSILDALERAEQERNARVQVPIGEPLSRPKRLWQRPVVWLFGAGLLLLNLLVWWLTLEDGIAPQLTNAEPPAVNQPVPKSEALVKPVPVPVVSPDKTTAPQLQEAVAKPAPEPTTPVPAASPIQQETQHATTPLLAKAEVTATDSATQKLDTAAKIGGKTTAPLLQEALAKSTPEPTTPVSAASSAQLETQHTATPPLAKAEVIAKDSTGQKTDAEAKTDPVPGETPDKTPTAAPLLQEAMNQPVPAPVTSIPTTQSVPLEAKMPAASQPATAEVAVKDAEVKLESPEPIPPPSPKPEATSPESTAETAQASVEAKRKGVASEPVLAQITPTVALEAEVEPEERIPRVWELPEAVQKKFKNLEINIHVYHEVPEARFVIIDMRRYREGDALDRPGLKLKRITREGVIIDYGKGRVRL